MKFSVVTISYNQAAFLRRCVDSVIKQPGVDIEYIVVDPGSTDGSRDIIDSYGDDIARRVYERDKGAADGLNRGFALATGEVYCYLISDDEFLPGTFKEVAEIFERHPNVDVLCGHAWIVDADGARLRRVWSDSYRRLPEAYGTSIQIQPSTFIRAEAFRRTAGFNIENRSNWDGELIADLISAGSTLRVVDRFWSLYRLHTSSITSSGSAEERIRAWGRERFRRLMRREWRREDDLIRLYWLIDRQVRHPMRALERLLRGRVYRRGA